MNSNHIHLLLKSPVKVAFQNFLRECSIRIVWLMTESKKGKKLLARFWESRPWSRIVEWGRAFSIVKAYVFRNRLESCGAIAYNRSVKTSVALRFHRATSDEVLCSEAIRVPLYSQESHSSSR